MFKASELLSFKTKIIIIGVIFALLPFFAPYYTNYMNKNSVNSVLVTTSQNQEHLFKVEIADSSSEWQKGLMYRETMCADCGMLFQMPERVQNFWMKNTFIPLDIIYIDSKGIIKKIYKSTTPKSLTPLSSIVPVNGVLEINGGMTDKLNIAEGDKVLHPYFKNIN